MKIIKDSPNLILSEIDSFGRPIFCWSKIDGILNYEINVDTDPSFIIMYMDFSYNSDQISWTPVTLKIENKTYYFRFRAIYPEGPGIWSNIVCIEKNNNGTIKYFSINNRNHKKSLIIAEIIEFTFSCIIGIPGIGWFYLRKYFIGLFFFFISLLSVIVIISVYMKNVSNSIIDWQLPQNLKQILRIVIFFIYTASNILMILYYKKK